MRRNKVKWYKGYVFYQASTRRPLKRTKNEIHGKDRGTNKSMDIFLLRLKIRSLSQSPATIVYVRVRTSGRGLIYPLFCHDHPSFVSNFRFLPSFCMENENLPAYSIKYCKIDD